MARLAAGILQVASFFSGENNMIDLVQIFHCFQLLELGFGQLCHFHKKTFKRSYVEKAHNSYSAEPTDSCDWFCNYHSI